MTFKHMIIISIAAISDLAAPEAAQSKGTTFERRLDAFEGTPMREQEVPRFGCGRPEWRQGNRCQTL